jgi:tRNA-dihydrouridine synthase B
MYTEMVQASSLRHLEAVPRIMEIDPHESPISIQLFDCRPDFLGAAAQIAVEQGADTIDLNMGCPVNKITKNGGGSALLRDPDTAVAIVRAVVEAVRVPVTVKTRIGWNDREINIVEFSQRLVDAGAQMLTVHARTRAQGYTGSAQWEWISKVKQAVSVPVIANGDIFSVANAIDCLEQTGADGVMCSRGTLGYPFLVGEIDRYLKTGELLPPPTPIDRLQCAKEHLEQLYLYKGDRGIFQARKHLTWYAKGFDGAAELRTQLQQINSVAEGQELLDRQIDKINKLG